MNSTIIGERIRYERQRLDMTLKELGKLLKVSEQCISGWEHGRNIPDIITLDALSKIFSIEIKDFLTMNDNKPNKKENPTLAELPSSLTLTRNDLLLIAKIHSLPSNKRQAIELLLGIKDN